MDNPLEILGLQKELVESLHASGRLDDFLRNYYRSLQFQIHPDRGGDGALAAKINAAYDAVQRQPANLASWIKQMGNGSGVSDEYLAVIAGLTAKVEELQKVQADYQKLREQYASVLASRAGSRERAEVRTATPRASRRKIFEDFEDEPEDTFDEPEIKRPKARRVDAAETAARERPAPKKKAPSRVEPIVLENIVLYGMDGKPMHTYKRLELDGEAVRGSDGKYLIKSQNGCSEYFTALSDGRRLPILPELYAIIERLHETKHPALDGIASDLNESWLCTGTKINYSKNKIIHPGVETINYIIPAGNYWLDEAVKKKPWENTLQALLMCKDAKKAVKVLHEASGKRPYIWTPDDVGRKSNPERAVWLGVGSGGLDLHCDYYPVINAGRFRGVRC